MADQPRAALGYIPEVLAAMSLCECSTYLNPHKPTERCKGRLCSHPRFEIVKQVYGTGPKPEAPLTVVVRCAFCRNDFEYVREDLVPRG